MRCEGIFLREKSPQMNALINRLFYKDETTAVLPNPEREERVAFLKSLIEKSSQTSEIRSIASRIEGESFDETHFISNCKLVMYYLQIEQYLIYKDPRYINSQQKLREEMAEQYPNFFKTKPFWPLQKKENEQEAVFCFLFVKYIIHQLKNNKVLNSYTHDWLRILNSKYIPPANLNIVERINLIQNLRKYTHEIYSELKKEKGIDFAQNHFATAYDKFVVLYPKFTSVKVINDLIPIEKNEITEEKPVRKLVSLPQNPTNGSRPKIDAYKSIFENILDGFILINTEGKIYYANDNAVRLCTQFETSLENKLIYNYLPSPILQQLKEDLENLESPLPSIVIGKRIEATFFEGTKHEEDVEITITNNFTKPEPTLSVLIKNISHKKQMLEAIRESKVHAERIAKAKSTFLSNMSHEIRTPLNVILGLTEILQKTEKLDETLIRKNLQGIDFSAKNLLSIVNDILDFSKIEAGKLSLQSIDFNLRKVVENLAEGFSIKAKEKGLDLHALIDKNVPDIVIGDQYRLNQILNNLISNAIKFTKHGNISIAIKLLKQNENDLVLQFMVTDTGIGISSDNLKKIFDSFYQVDNMENSGGTGLGLAITRELIYLHEGEFHAESEIDKGSKFTFTIPYKKSSLISLADSTKSSVDSTKKLDGLRVLVAEDNEMNQFYIKQLLKKLNVEADIAENGKEAVDILKSKKDTYDLVLMDMHMPVMSGMEAISHIRKLNGTTVKKLPIVACSADVFPEARKNAIKAGIDFYLTKPLSEDAVKELLYWLVSDKPAEGSTTLNNNSETLLNTDTNKSNIALNALLETFENDKDFVISLLEVFVKTTPEDYNNLCTCVDREFYARASELAHKLKSSFMNLGMITHGHHLQQIESLLLSKKTINEGLRHLITFKSLYHKALLEVNLLLIELRQK